MAKVGPIILIEDDEDDYNMFAEILNSLNIKNKLHWFTSPPAAMEFLKSSKEQPFIIFCDMNLPQQNGIEFKKNIDNNPQLRKKSIPFIFYTTSANKAAITEAYIQLTVQGYFEKPGTYEEIKQLLQLIYSYWQMCKHPNS